MIVIFIILAYTSGILCGKYLSKKENDMTNDITHHRGYIEGWEKGYNNGWDDATKIGIKESHKYQDLLNEKKK